MILPRKNYDAPLESELRSSAAQMLEIDGWQYVLADQSLHCTSGSWAILGITGPDEPPTLRQMLRWFSTAERSRLLRAFVDCARHGTPFDLQVQSAKTGGPQAWVRVAAQPTRNGSQAIIAVRGAVEDISSWKGCVTDLEAQVRLMQTMVESMPHIFWTADSEGRITYVNQQLAAMSGLDAHEALNEGWLRVLHPDDVAPTMALWRAAVRAPSFFNTQYRFYDVTAQDYEWLQVTAMPLRGADGEFTWFGTCTNIHESKIASEQAARLAARLVNTLEGMNDAFLTLSPDLRITYANASAGRLFGRAPDALSGRALWDEFDRDSLGDLFAPALEALASGQSCVDEVHVATLACWLQVHALPADEGVALRLRDATSRHRAEEQLRASEERLRLTLDHALDAHVAADGEGRIIGWNRQAEQVFGWSRDEALGQALSAVLPSTMPGHASALAAQRAIPQRLEVTALRSDGAPFPAEVSLVPIRMGADTISNVSVRDLTERNQMNTSKKQRISVLESIADGAPLEQVLDALARIAEEQVSSALATVVLLAEDERSLILGAGPRLPPSLSAELAVVPLTAPPTRGTFSQQHDDGAAPLWEGVRERAVRHGLQEHMVLPLSASDGELLGAFTLHFALPCENPEEARALTLPCAHIASIAIERDRTEQRARAADAELHLRQRAIEVCANPIAIMSEAPGYPVSYVNPAFEKVTGYAPDEILGKDLQELWRTDPDQPGVQLLLAARYERRVGRALIKAARRDGGALWLEAHTSPVPDAEGRVSHCVTVLYDVTESKRYEAELEYLATHDTLTGLPNRSLLRDRAEQEIGRAATQGKRVWIAYIALERFGRINEVLGQEAGDQVLFTVGKRLQAALRAGDTLARMPGNEFAAVITSAPVDDAGLLQQVIAAADEPLLVGGHQIALTCSIGVAEYPTDGIDADNLLKQAQLALNRARESKNVFQFYTAAMNERALERLRLQSDLRQAIERDELTLVYQPLIDLHDGRVVGTEALLRWHHPLLGAIPPSQFIPLAEETGLIQRIGAWVLETACRQNKAWLDSGYLALSVSVNVSVKQLYQDDFIAVVCDVLEHTGLPAELLNIELTESLVAQDSGRAIELLAQLKKVGVKLSIDDFGTGYSSLSYLKNFPMDVLKVDKSFVQYLATKPEDGAIVQAIITLAHSLGLRVVAEGVETEEQLGFLKRHGCDQVQGFLFSRPVPAAELEGLLRDGKAFQLGQSESEPGDCTLLLVDDERNVTSSLARLFRGKGFRILCAHSGEEGLSILARNNVQVILSDHLMPGMSGIDFLSRVKKMYPDTIRLILSGYTSVDSIIAATNSRAVFRFHTKPWDSEALCGSIEEAFRYYHMMQRAA